MSNSSDRAIQRPLSNLIDHVSTGSEARIQAVKSHRRSLRRSREAVRKVAAFALVLFLSGAFLWAGYRWGSSMRNGGDSRVTSREAPISSASDIVSLWGGTLVSGVSGGTATITIDSPGEERSIELPFAALNDPMLSPQGLNDGLFAYGLRRPYVVGIDGSPVAISGAKGTGGNFSWAPAGHRFAIELCSDQSVCALNTYPTAEGSPTQWALSSGRGLSWSPDGMRVVFVNREGALAVVDVATGDTQQLLAPDDALATLQPNSLPVASARYWLAPSWSSTGAYIAAILDVGTGYVPVVLEAAGTPVGLGSQATLGPPNLAWRPGYDELFYAEGPVEGGFGTAEPTSLFLMAAPTWSSTPILSVVGEPIRGLFSAPSGSTVLLQTLDEARVQQAQGAGPPAMWWSLIDADTGALVARTNIHNQVFDWA
jgi:hypothetical protein